MSRKAIIRSVTAVLLGTVGLGYVLQAMPASAKEEQIEEIIVTARKRQESILKVPVIETAITQQTLRQFGTHGLQQLSQQVPDLLMGSATGAFGLQVSMRGVGTTTLNSAIDQSVSLNLDGVQIAEGLAYTAGMFDVAQVEVLKGPQALFYGKSSPGGVISLRSNDPTDQTEVMLQGGYEFEANERTGELIVSGPVTDTLKMRLAAKYASQDGFFKNAAVGDPTFGGVTPHYKDFAPETDYLLRGTVLWNPSEKFDARLKVNYTKTRVDGDGGGLQYASCPGGTAPTVSVLQFLGVTFIDPKENCKIDRTIRLVDMSKAAFPFMGNNGIPYEDLWQSFGSLEANYHPTPDLTVTSVTGYYILRQGNVINGTLSEVAAPMISTDNNFFRRDISEEVRVNSDFDGPFNFTVGGLYHNGYINEIIRGEFNTSLGFPPYLQLGSEQVNIHAVSFFGQGRYKILPDLELAAGARWTHEWRTFDAYAQIINGAPVTPGPVPTAVPKISSYHLNPEVTLTYTPTDDLTLFGSYKEASKSGSFDTTIIVPNTDQSFGDEGVRGGEVGIKGYLFNRRASFSLDGYYYNYSNLQVGANQVVGGVVVDRTLNAASANIHGVEFSGNYLVEAVDGLSLNGALSWNSAHYDQFPNALCWGGQTISEGCNRIYSASANNGLGGFTSQDLSGRVLVRAPEWSANFGFNYVTSIWNDMTLAIGSNTSFTSRYFTDLVERYDMIQRSFFKTNLSISLSAPDNSWEVALIGNDLNNEITTGNCVNAPFRDGVLWPVLPFTNTQYTGRTTSGPSGADGLACNVDRGREVWLRVTLHPLDLMHE